MRTLFGGDETAASARRGADLPDRGDAVGAAGISPYVVLPGQFSRTPAAQTGEHNGTRRLMAAVLEDAVMVLTKFGGSPDRRARGMVAEAWAFFSSEDRHYVFSFLNICDVLDFDPDAIRSRLAKVRAGAPLRVPLRGARQVPPGRFSGLSDQAVLEEDAFDEMCLRIRRTLGVSQPKLLERLMAYGAPAMNQTTASDWERRNARPNERAFRALRACYAAVVLSGQVERHPPARECAAAGDVRQDVMAG